MKIYSPSEIAYKASLGDHAPKEGVLALMIKNYGDDRVNRYKKRFDSPRKVKKK